MKKIIRASKPVTAATFMGEEYDEAIVRLKSELKSALAYADSLQYKGFVDQTMLNLEEFLLEAQTTCEEIRGV